MQNLVTITRQPILMGLLLSIAVHAAMLGDRSIYTPPRPHMEIGRTTLQLTLRPALSVAPADAPSLKSTAEMTTDLQSKPSRIPVPPDEAAAECTPASATQSEDHKGVTSSAAARSPFHPAYPRISRQRGEEGAVRLMVRVLPDGTAGAIDIVQSSGYRRLDHAAVEAAGMTVYDPALLLGQAVESEIELSYTYRLTDD